MRIPPPILRVVVHGPAVLVSLGLWAVFLAAMPPALGLPGLVALILTATLLAAGRLEGVAISVLWWARPANGAEAAILGAARTNLGVVGVEVHGVYVRRRRARGPVVEAVGHQGAVVVDPGLLQTVQAGAVSPAAAAAMVAHAVGCRGVATPRHDVAVRAVTAPWRVLRGGAAHLARAGAGHPLLTFTWKVRWLAGVVCLLLPPPGQAPAAWLGGAVVALSYLQPAAQRALARQTELAGDQLVISAGLGPALADLLGTTRGCASAVRRQRLEAVGPSATQRHLQLVRD